MIDAQIIMASDALIRGNQTDGITAENPGSSIQGLLVFSSSKTRSPDVGLEWERLVFLPQCVVDPLPLLFQSFGCLPR
jgi:hypothetical protein